MMSAKAVAYWCGLGGFLSAAVVLAGFAGWPVMWFGGAALVVAVLLLDRWARKHDGDGRLGTGTESSLLGVASSVLLVLAFLSRGTSFASWSVPILALAAFALVLCVYLRIKRRPEAAD